LVKIISPFGHYAVYIDMSINKKEFIENLDSVLELFRQFKEKMVRNNTAVDHNLIRNFDEIIRNYQIIREEIPDELISKYGMPIQVMALHLVEQLRYELERQRNKNQRQKVENSIDDLLRNPDLSEKEINALLDKRIAIMKNHIRS
jgi:hypothetical protein